MRPGIWQLLIVLVIVALIFGTKKLATMGEDLGSGIKGFKKGMKDEGEGGKIAELESQKSEAVKESDHV